MVGRLSHAQYAKPSCTVAAASTDITTSVLSLTHLHALLSTRGVVVDLVALLTAFLGPREVRNGDEEEGVAGVGDTGERVVPGVVLASTVEVAREDEESVPCDEGSEDAESATCNDATFLWCCVGSGGLATVDKVANAEQEEGHVEGEEEEEESYSRSDCAD